MDERLEALGCLGGGDAFATVVEVDEDVAVMAHAQFLHVGQLAQTEATIYGPRELTTANPARRTFVLDLTWRFNATASKYRGTGAGEKQKARM